MDKHFQWSIWIERIFILNTANWKWWFVADWLFWGFHSVLCFFLGFCNQVKPSYFLICVWKSKSITVKIHLNVKLCIKLIHLKKSEVFEIMLTTNKIPQQNVAISKKNVNIHTYIYYIKSISQGGNRDYWYQVTRKLTHIFLLRPHWLIIACILFGSWYFSHGLFLEPHQFGW